MPFQYLRLYSINVGGKPAASAQFSTESWFVCQSHLVVKQERHGWETWPLNFAYEASFHARKVLLHAINVRHGTDGFTSPPKEVVLRIFITLKNPSSLAGFEPMNLGPSGKHATTRPPRTTGG
jgi:hypothetical protein